MVELLTKNRAYEKAFLCLVEEEWTMLASWKMSGASGKAYFCLNDNEFNEQRLTTSNMYEQSNFAVPNPNSRIVGQLLR